MTDEQPKRTRRKMTIAGWLKIRYPGDERITWDDLWLNHALLVAYRGRCSRDRVGAVLVDDDNCVMGVGYNGPPAGLDVTGPCDHWCPRAINGPDGSKYDDCYAVHAELNCIMRAKGKPITGGSLYVSSAVCWRCATMIANSGITRVVMRATVQTRRDRGTDKVVAYLMECGIEVVVIDQTSAATSYRAIYLQEHGYGPHRCHFCDVPMPWPEVIHHLDGDHSNNDVDNLTAAHASCHANYHKAVNPAGWTGAARVSVTTKFTRRKPKLTCKTCGLETTPGWLKRHADELGHDRTVYDEWRAMSDQEREEKRRVESTCSVCDREFKSKRGMQLHLERSKCSTSTV